MNLEEQLNRLFENWGYRKFRPSKFEEYDLYAENKDFLKSSQIITFTDLDGSLLALKPDITLSIIKNNQENFDKLYYNENVYRPKDHHYQEIPQAGVECIGEVSVFEEAEILTLAAMSLSLISENYVLRISDLSLLDEILSNENIDASLHKDLLQDISEKNTSEIEKKVSLGLISSSTGDVLKSLIALYHPMSDDLELDIFKHLSEDKIEHLGTLRELLQSFGIADKVYLDFSLINSLDYYNGIIFQGAVSHIPFTILSGGRYDRLSEKMGKSSGAIGFAIYMDIVSNYMVSEKLASPELLLIYDTNDDFSTLAQTCKRLRSKGQNIRTVPRAYLESSEKLFRNSKVISLDEAKEM